MSPGRILRVGFALSSLICMAFFPPDGRAWWDETHLAIARAAGHRKWYHAAGADLAKLKLGDAEGHNHYVNNACGTRITPAMVFEQAGRYDRIDPEGHLYGAILGALRGFLDFRARNLYAEYHLAYAVHYIGDLSQPLHHLPHDDYNRKFHAATDGVLKGEALRMFKRIPLYPIAVGSEEDLAREIARIAGLSLELGCALRKENRLIERGQAWEQIGHSASLLRAVLRWLEAEKREGSGEVPEKDPG